MNKRLEKQKTRIETREKTDRRLTIIALLLLLFAISIGGIYGYWAGTIADPAAKAKTEELTIGEGKDVNTVLDVTGALAANGKKLVPTDKAVVSKGGTAENVEFFETTYKVFWKEDGTEDIIKPADLVNGTLSITGEGVITGAEAHNNLVKVEVNPASAQITADGAGVDVIVRVTLTEPENKAVYDAIINKKIAVNLNFSVAQ